MNRHRRSESTVELYARKLQVAFQSLSHDPNRQADPTQPGRRYFNRRGLILGSIGRALVEKFDLDQLHPVAEVETQRLFWSFLSAGLILIEQHDPIDRVFGLRYWVENAPSNLPQFVMDREALMMRSVIWVPLLKTGDKTRLVSQQDEIPLRISELIYSQRCQVAILQNDKRLLIKQLKKIND